MRERPNATMEGDAKSSSNVAEVTKQLETTVSAVEIQELLLSLIHSEPTG